MKIAQLTLALEFLEKKYFKNIKSVMDMGTKSLRVKYDDLEFLFKQSNIKFDKKKIFFFKKISKRSKKIY